MKVLTWCLEQNYCIMVLTTVMPVRRESVTFALLKILPNHPESNLGHLELKKTSMFTAATFHSYATQCHWLPSFTDLYRPGLYAQCSLRSNTERKPAWLSWKVYVFSQALPPTFHRVCNICAQQYHLLLLITYKSRSHLNDTMRYNNHVTFCYISSEQTAASQSFTFK